MNNQRISLVLGATKGLGNQIANECRKSGDWTLEVGSSIQKQEDGDNVTYLPCDLTDEGSVRRLLKRLKFDKLQPISRFFWVAGRLIEGELASQQNDEILNVID